MKKHLPKTATKTKSKKTKAAPTPAEQFSKLWKQVQKEKTNISDALQQQTELVARFNAEVLTDEIALSNQLYSETQHLIGFLSKKSLSSRHREILTMWILSQIEILNSRPFEMDHSVHELGDAVKAHFPEFSEEDIFDDNLFDEDSFDSAQKNQQRKQNESKQEDLFGFDDFEQQESAQHVNDDEDIWEYDEDPWGNRESARDTKTKADAKAAEALFNASSMNKMFRQLAKIFHPDLAQDEQQKAIKHEQMANLLKAREKQDVLTIFELFCTHCDKSLPSFDDQELKRLNELLKQQVRNLQAEKNEALFENRFHGMIYERFYRKNSQLIALALKDHKESVRKTIGDSQRLVKQTSTLKALTRALNVKEIELEMAMEMAFMESFEAYI
jgi:hypothetical protein